MRLNKVRIPWQRIVQVDIRPYSFDNSREASAYILMASLATYPALRHSPAGHIHLQDKQTYIGHQTKLYWSQSRPILVGFATYIASSTDQYSFTNEALLSIAA